MNFEQNFEQYLLKVKKIQKQLNDFTEEATKTSLIMPFFSVLGYDVFDTDANEYSSEYGEEYTLKSNFDFLFGKLHDGEYSISYQLEKLNGIPSYTTPKDFSVEKECITIKK